MRHNSRCPDFGNDNMFSRAAKRACWYADRFKNRFSRVPFVRGCSGPFGEETPGTWQTFEEVAYNWCAAFRPSQARNFEPVFLVRFSRQSFAVNRHTSRDLAPGENSLRARECCWLGSGV